MTSSDLVCGKSAPCLQTSPRLYKNNFDLLRLLLAGSVCLVHTWQLSGYQQLQWLGSILSTSVAVKAFFIVSGFLVFMSFERSSSLQAYATKRFLRIYPAYFVVIMLGAIGLPVIGVNSTAEYFSDVWLKYVLANLAFLNFVQPTLPGIFESNMLSAVNGALWTLKIEVMFYCSVPLMVFLFRRFGPLRVVAVVYMLSLAYAMLFTWLAETTGGDPYLELGRQLPGQLCYFMAGALFYYALPAFERYVDFAVPAALGLILINLYKPLPVLEPLALATTVMFFALFGYCGNVGRYGDFSYGVYILHFPIIQTFLHLHWLADHPGIFLVAVIVTTAIAAMGMWHLVEKRFLFRNSHYVAATSRPMSPVG